MKRTTVDERREIIRSLRIKRSSAKGVTTKRIHKLENLMNDYDNIDEVRKGVIALKSAFIDFKQSHNMYHTELSDEYDLEESNEYYASEEAKVSSTMRTRLNVG